MADFARGFCTSVDNSVGAVLASEADSTELRVDVMLCLDVDRRMLARLDALALLGLRLMDLTELCELDPAQRRPRNREAAACI